MVQRAARTWSRSCRGCLPVTEVRRTAHFGAVAVMVVVFGVVAVVAARAGPGWAFSGSSLASLLVELTARRRRSSPRGSWSACAAPMPARAVLLAAAGLLRLVAEWNNPDGAPGALVFTVGLALAAAAAGPLAHAMLVHGDGQLRDAASWVAAITVYAAAVGLFGSGAGARRRSSRRGLPGLLSEPASGHDAILVLGESFYQWGLVLLVGALALTIFVALLRVALASSAQRRLIAPVVIPGCVTLGLIAGDAAHSWQRGFLSNDPVDRRLWLLEAVAIWLVVGGVGWQRASARRFRAALAGVVMELADSPRAWWSARGARRCARRPGPRPAACSRRRMDRRSGPHAACSGARGGRDDRAGARGPRRRHARTPAGPARRLCPGAGARAHGRAGAGARPPQRRAARPARAAESLARRSRRGWRHRTSPAGARPT